MSFNYYKWKGSLEIKQQKKKTLPSPQPSLSLKKGKKREIAKKKKDVWISFVLIILTFFILQIRYGVFSCMWTVRHTWIFSVSNSLIDKCCWHHFASDFPAFSRLQKIKKNSLAPKYGREAAVVSDAVKWHWLYCCRSVFSRQQKYCSMDIEIEWRTASCLLLKQPHHGRTPHGKFSRIH